MAPRYPQISVQLSGQDGNAFIILGVCLRAAKEAGLSQQETDAFLAQATKGDYAHLLCTAAAWFMCT